MYTTIIKTAIICNVRTVTILGTSLTTTTKGGGENVRSEGPCHPVDVERQQLLYSYNTSTIQ